MPLAGCWLITLEPMGDERGWFARSFCRNEFARRGIDMEVVQANTSFNRLAGTLRGMHYQVAPHAERKLVRCARGAVFDVAVDLRAGSGTHCQWFATELTSENGRLLFLPEGVAHGFQTLVDDSEMSYLMSAEYHAAAARGVRWDDPAFGIPWPAAERVISERDRGYADYRP